MERRWYDSMIQKTELVSVFLCSELAVCRGAMDGKERVCLFVEAKKARL